MDDLTCQCGWDSYEKDREKKNMVVTSFRKTNPGLNEEWNENWTCPECGNKWVIANGR